MTENAFTPAKPLPQKHLETSGKATASLICGLLSFCFSLFAAIPAVILGLLALGDIRRSQGRLGGTGLAVGGIVISLINVVVAAVAGVLLIIPAVQAARNAARVAVTSNNLKRIGLGMHNYHDAFKSFPMAGAEDKSLGIGLSWRVRILPYIEQQPLYDKFDFNSPWDSPQNKALISLMPDIYKAPGTTLEEGKTIYLGVLGATQRDPGWEERFTFFNSGDDSTRISDCLDGTANTVMIVEADPSEAVIWTKPDDWDFDPQAPRRGLGTLRMTGFPALFADGSVALVPDSTSEVDLRRMFLLRDGQPFESFEPPYFGH